MKQEISKAIQQLRDKVTQQREKILLVKTRYTQKLEEKNEIEKLVRTCIDDLKRELWDVKANSGSMRFEKKENGDEKILQMRKIEAVLDREKKLTLLYDKLFHRKGNNGKRGFVMQ